MTSAHILHPPEAGSFLDRHHRGTVGRFSVESIASIVGVPWSTPFFSNNLIVIAKPDYMPVKTTTIIPRKN
jgi:hypothetical protein